MVQEGIDYFSSLLLSHTRTYHSYIAVQIGNYIPANTFWLWSELLVYYTFQPASIYSREYIFSRCQDLNYFDSRL